MEIASKQIDDDITRISLQGRLDFAGAQEIDMKFTALAAARKASVLVDLSGVSFIASIGIRTLLSSAKAQANRGGKLVLCNMQPLVSDVLVTAGVNQLIPLYDDEEAGIKALNEA